MLSLSLSSYFFNGKSSKKLGALFFVALVALTVKTSKPFTFVTLNEPLNNKPLNFVINQRTNISQAFPSLPTHKC